VCDKSDEELAGRHKKDKVRNSSEWVTVRPWSGERLYADVVPKSTCVSTENLRGEKST